MELTEQHLKALSIPVHVVWGTDDAWIPVETGRRLSELITGARYVEVPGAGHLIQYDAPLSAEQHHPRSIVIRSVYAQVCSCH